MDTFLQPLAGIAGTFLLLAGLIDMVSTAVLVSEGGGWVTRRVLNWGWKCWIRLARLRFVPSEYGGPIHLLLVFAVWTFMLTSGWTLIVWAMDPSASFLQIGMGVAGLAVGRGDLSPEFADWMKLGIGLSGVVLVSLTVSYVIAVVSAVAFVRHVSMYLATFGTTVDEVLHECFEEGSPHKQLDLHLLELTTLVTHIAAKALAFPVVETFQPPTARRAIAVRLAVFVAAVHRAQSSDAFESPYVLTVRPLLRAVDAFLEVHPVRLEPGHARERLTPSQRTEALERWAASRGWSIRELIEPDTKTETSASPAP